jgi:hypothetical protein
MRQRAALFGHNAPDWPAMPDSVKSGYLGTGLKEWPGFTITSVSSFPFVSTDAQENGLTGEYYDSQFFTDLKFTRIDGTVDFDWAYGSPDSSIGSDTFSIRWSGWLKPKTSATYMFYTVSDDGVRLWVNDQLVIDNWTEHAETENRGSIYLKAEEQVSIKLEYFEKQGVAKIRLSWSAPGLAKGIIPQQLYPGVQDNTGLLKGRTPEIL